MCGRRAGRRSQGGKGQEGEERMKGESAEFGSGEVEGKHGRKTVTE